MLNIIAMSSITPKLPKSLDIPVTCLVTPPPIVNAAVKEKALTFCGLMSQTKRRMIYELLAIVQGCIVISLLKLVPSHY